MGLLSLFKSGDEPANRREKGVEWTPLETRDQLEDIVTKSTEVPQIIFKNSTTCGISGMVRRSFESHFSVTHAEAELYLLHVQYNRDLSNTVASDFGIRHESPQLLIIKDGKVVCHGSHSQITTINLSEWL